MINFEDASILGINSENKFFGEAFRYQTVKSLSIQGAIYNLSNESGVAEIWSGISGIVESSNDYDDILIRGISFGAGRIDSCKFTEGNDVRKKGYQIALTVWETGNLFNLTGKYYSGLNFSNANLIDRFSENFELSVDENETYKYQRNISCKFIAGSSVGNPIEMAVAFASGMFAIQPDFGLINQTFSGYGNEPARRLFKETYNAITNECAFTQSFTIPAFLNSSGGFSAKYDYTLSTNDRSATTVQEHGFIQGLVYPYDDSAQSGFEAVISGAYERCNAKFMRMTSGVYYPLNTNRLNLVQKINTFEGNIDYEVSYSNDIQLASGQPYSWEYVLKRAKRSCINYITEQGKVVGLSQDCNFLSRYANALSGFAIVQSGIGARVSGFMANFGVHSMREMENSEQQNIFQGHIGYTAAFTDMLISTYVPGLIRKIETEVEDAPPVDLVNSFIALGFNGQPGAQILQDAGIPTAGQRTVTTKVYGYLGVPRTVLLSGARSSLNSFQPTGYGDCYLTSAGYSIVLATNLLTAKATWAFYTGWNYLENTMYDGNLL